MKAYQQKWIDVLSQTNIPGWKFEALDNDVVIDVPTGRSIKEIADNLETVIAELSLDINLPKERMRFVITNGREELDYVLNPEETDLTTEDDK
ncbi:hypothetical protein [Mucilaginibacter ginkgonis]|uniref:Uncharacterized protein n=1 Tax=Mucilaginibacter ginkgonis TaxID=2682091 RepID=A0A6I4I2T0_9SPHI|nr:hypothetical protein [Mucilaginibacter ginkgonis]QQL48290.1 hypothetical protein GO620_008780 [Mucilaginibacter ginkgonis]